MAVTLKLSFSDPMLVKLICVWDGVVYLIDSIQRAKNVQDFKKSTASQKKTLEKNGTFLEFLLLLKIDISNEHNLLEGKMDFFSVRRVIKILFENAWKFEHVAFLWL